MIKIDTKYICIIISIITIYIYESYVSNIKIFDDIDYILNSNNECRKVIYNKYIK